MKINTKKNESTKNADYLFNHLIGLIEAGIFLSEEPITVKQLSTLTGEKLAVIKDRVEKLAEYYRRGPRGIRLVETGGGFRFETDPTYAPALKKYFKAKEGNKLSKAAMETLSIIAYKQPITSPEISEIRSVDSAGVIHTLLDKKLIKIMGRKEVVGRPLLYGTSRQFFVRFGLNSITDLPDFAEFTQIISSQEDISSLKKEFDDHFSPNKQGKHE